MSVFLLAAAALVLVTVAVGLFRILRGPASADRMMAAQLLGTGGIAALLLLGVANTMDAALDVALLLALLAPFAAVGLVRGGACADDNELAAAPRRGDGAGADAGAGER